METRPKPTTVLAVTSLAVFAVSLDTTVLYVAFPSIGGSFAEVSTAQLSWVLNAYTVVFGALLVPAGRLADRVGRRQVFTAGVVVFTGASVVCGIAPTAATLIAARAGQAIGAAMLLPSSLALVLAAFPRERRAVAVSLWGAVGALSVAIGPSVGSLVIELVDWRGVFFMNMPVGIAAMLLARRIVPESKDPSAGALPDLAGILVLIIAVGALALGIVQGNDWGWTGPRTVASLTLAAAAFALFAVASRRAAAPVVDFTLFRDRTYALANVATVVFAVAFTAMFFALILFQTQVWRYSILEAGLGITPGPLMVIPTAIIAGRVAARRGHRGVLVAGGILYAIGGVILVAALPSHPAYLSRFLPAALITGVGVGLVLPSLAGAAVHGLPEARFALGSAMNQAVRQLGSVLGVALVVALLERAPTPAGFRDVFALLVIGGLGTAVLALGIDTHPHPRGVRSHENHPDRARSGRRRGL